MEQGVEEGIADFLHHIGRARVAHEGRAGVAPDDGAGEGGGNIHGAPASLRRIHALVVAAKEHQRPLGFHKRAHGVVVGLLARAPRDGEIAGQAHFVFEEIA